MGWKYLAKWMLSYRWIKNSRKEKYDVITHNTEFESAPHAGQFSCTTSFCPRRFPAMQGHLLAPILQMWKLRLREGKQLPQICGYVGRTGILAQVSL